MHYTSCLAGTLWFSIIVALLVGLPTTFCTAGVHSLIFPRNGDGIAGEIIGADDDSLSIVTEYDGMVRLARTDVARIVARRDGERGRGFVAGTMVGLVGWNFAMGTASSEQPAPYLHTRTYGGNGYKFLNDGFAALVGLLSMGVGGGIGHILNPGNDYTEQTFSFAGEEREQSAVWDEFHIWLAPGQMPKRFRMSLVSALVFPPMLKSFEEDAGRTALVPNRQRNIYLYAELLDRDSRVQYRSLDEANDFNLVRRLTATYNLLPSLDVGAGVVWTGEPVIFAGMNNNPSGGDALSEYGGLRQIVRGHGYYAIALFNAAPWIDRQWNISAGGGPGLATGEYRLDGFLRRDSGDVVLTQKDYHHAFSGTWFSLLTTAEVSYSIFRNISLGLTADYAFVFASHDIPAVEFLGLSERTFRPGNGII